MLTRNTRPARSSVLILFVLAATSCGGDDPPPADIHPLETKPFPIAPLAKKQDDSEQKRVLALVITYAQKHYPDLDVTRHQVIDWDDKRKHIDMGPPPPIDERPLWDIVFPEKKIKTSDAAEASNQGFIPAISARRFTVYIKDRIVEADPIRIPSFAHH